MRKFANVIAASFAVSLFLGSAGCDSRVPTQPHPTHAQSEIEQSPTMSRVRAFMQQWLALMEDDQSINDFYAKLPALQQDKPSLPEFQQYVHLLREEVITGQVLSYTPMTQSERTAYLSTLIQNRPSYQKMEGNLLSYWLEIKRPDDSRDRFPFFLWLNNDGQPTLSREWITDSNRLYAYAQLYFSTLKREKPEELTALLQKDTKLDPELLNNQIQAILNYYDQLKRLLPNLLDQLRVTALRGDLIEIEQPYPLELATNTPSDPSGTPDGLQPRRRIQFRLDDEQDYSVFDIIPPTYSPHRFTLYRNGYQLLSLDQPVDTNTLQRIFGNWQEAYFHPQQEGSEEGVIEVRYPQLTLSLTGRYDAARQRFSGQVAQIAFQTADYHLEQLETIGWTPLELARLYPFLAQNKDYLSTLQGQIHFTFNQGKVSSITLSRVGFTAEPEAHTPPFREE